MAKSRSNRRPPVSKRKRHFSQDKNNTSKKPKKEDKTGKEIIHEGFPLVAFGASAGGINAFKNILKELPPDLGMAFVYIQHLDPHHQSLLDELFTKVSKMPVKQVFNGLNIQPNHVYVIPPNYLMHLDKNTFQLTQRTEKSGHFMPIDYFFHSLAKEKGSQSIGVILSGTASDGVNGLKAIKAEGGISLCQDTESAEYDGMPRSAIAAGCVDFILPPIKIAEEISKIGHHQFDYFQHTNDSDIPLEDDGQLNKILYFLKKFSGVDFSFYKQGTIKRRIRRRMVLNHVENIAAYIEFIKNHSSELERLYNDILICVTNFFRDPETFTALRKTVFPKMLEDRQEDHPIRIWVPGCSTGEEVYSLAIALVEFLSQRESQIPLQIFGTDISENALDIARQGYYPESIKADVSEERLKRFFVRAKNGYQISKHIRNMCIFSKQNVTKDPPFSRLDLISCRNLLIYLGGILQKKVLPIFHYALNSNGILLLGSAETVGSFKDLFILRDKKNKIHSKKGNSSLVHHVMPESPISYPKKITANFSSTKLNNQLDKFDIAIEADRIALNRFTPPSVLINDEMDVIQFRGQTGRYLQPASGKASLNLLKMVRSELHMDLRSAIFEAKKSKISVCKKNLTMNTDGHEIRFQIDVVPLQVPMSAEYYYLIFFTEENSIRHNHSSRPSSSASSSFRENSQKKNQLAEELKSTRVYLQRIIEDQESTNEELRSANEEIQSSNEELQSTNEELETAKEELQSSNEELITVNEELHNRNADLSQANDDFTNLLSNIQIPIIILGHDRIIRRTTPITEKILNLSENDVGRALDKVRLKIDLPYLNQWIDEVIDSLRVKEEEIQDQEGHWYSLRIRPYRTHDSVIEGVVIVLYDIEVIKRLEMARQARDYADAIINTVREPILILDEKLIIQQANRSFFKTFHLESSDVQNKLVYEIEGGRWNVPEFKELIDNILMSKNEIEDFQFIREVPGLGQKRLSCNVRKVLVAGPSLILVSIQILADKLTEKPQP